MKASELRIGNFIFLDEVKVVEVWGIEPNHNNIWVNKNKGASVIAENLKYLKPIPLTEEWLFKLGFIYNNEDEAYINRLLWLEKQGDKFGVWKGEYGNNHLRTITYVHQLQNLYHALTGGELLAK